MTATEIALKKFSVGDGLTDNELALLMEMFERMQNDLRSLSQHFNAGFGLALSAVRQNLQTLESFKHARDNKGK